MSTYKASAIRNTALYDGQQDRVVVEEIVLNEADGSAAGVYSGSITIPSNSYVIDVLVHNVALWTAGTSATLIVGDGVDDDCYFTGVDLEATDLLAGEGIDFNLPGGQQGADVVETLTEGTPNTLVATQLKRSFLTDSRTITAKVTTVGTAAATGITRVIVIHARPGTSQTATFVAS